MSARPFARICRSILVLGWTALSTLNGFSQSFNSIVITEIMADPTPVVGLPDAEYLELFNRSGQAVSLKGWKLGMNDRTAVLPDSVLAPGGYIILCARTSVGLLASQGRVVGLTPFTLVNAGSILTLRNSKGALVHTVSYKDSWWTSNKRAGGYALEMIDTNNPCGEANNWRASVAPPGGTPGKPNSVAAPNPDRSPPLAERVGIATANEIKVYFNESLDSLASLSSGRYEIQGREIRKSFLESPAFKVLSLTVDAPLLPGQRYELTLKNSTDCAGNRLAETRFQIGLPARADSGDVIVNEILFDPRTGGVEFVELYNRSSKFINLKNWSIGNVRNGQPASLTAVSAGDLLLGPNAFIALTRNAELLASQYPTEQPRTILSMSLPAYVNEAGGVVLQNESGQLFDRFDYRESYHSPLLTSTKGVSLERIYPEKPGNDPRNWHSAASVAGYATPGYTNSQGVYAMQEESYVVEPEVITPDGDGRDDFATIRYTLPGPGQVASIRVYDVQGRLIKNLILNQMVGTEGSVRWEGTNEQGEVVRMGYYLLLIDAYDAQGGIRQFKKKVVVALP